MPKLNKDRNNQTLDIEADAVIPPDPEGMNESRAEWALAGVRGFLKDCQTDDEDAIADFLCDLMHLCDRMPKHYGTFANNLRRAQSNYAEECDRQSAPDPLQQFVESISRMIPYKWTANEGYDDEQGGDAISSMNDLIQLACDVVGVVRYPDSEVGEQEYDEEDWSCDNCGETAQDGSGKCITCGQEA